jgi:hypothetical protein
MRVGFEPTPGAHFNRVLGLQTVSLHTPGPCASRYTSQPVDNNCSYHLQSQNLMPLSEARTLHIRLVPKSSSISVLADIATFVFHAKH